MLKNISLQKILFLDIETVPREEKWEDLSEKLQFLWEKKTKHQRNDLSVEDFYYERAAILAEFGKIVCISCGYVTNNNFIRLKSFYGADEKEILMNFSQLLHSHFSKLGYLLCAHNGKEFDFPYLARRMIINQIEIPPILDTRGKKPWEVTHLDTLDLWKFGDYKHYTSLDLLANVLEIPSPKNDMDGSEVSKIFYEERNLERIKTYCEKDVITIIQVFRRFRNESLLEVEDYE